MPFGLTNILAVFQWFINDIFLDFLSVCIVIYLVNIIIYSNDMFQYVKEVLYQLYKTRLYTKAEKCEFYSKSIGYLKYILSLSKLTMPSNKISTI